MQIARERYPLSHYHHQPGDTPRYCHECKSMKPMGPRSSRCAECATKHKEIDDSLLMPRPFLRGQVHNWDIGMLARVEQRMQFRAPMPEGCRALGWLVLPPFQRPPVWTLEQQTRFIESIWLHLPIGMYIYNDPEPFQHPTDAWLLDGQQRVTAIMSYMSGGIEAFGYCFGQLSKLEQQQFEMRQFPAFVTRETDVARLEEIYNRLAYGGTPHEPRS